MTLNKPLLRGRLHQGAFYTTLTLSVFYIIFVAFNLFHFHVSALIYLASQLTLYGISSFYHIFDFKTQKIRRIFQQLDHASIFFLISGTQTCVITALVPLDLGMTLLIVSWTISCIGIFKVIFVKAQEMIDVLFYICHGVCVVPFLKVMANYLTFTNWICVISGGVLYIVGGIIFGIEKPDPWPTIFGYHEIFHLLTILANLCFMVPVVTKYIK